jgi:CBS domain-containing protein
MPYQVQQLLEGQGALVTVSKEDTVAHALSLMIEHDFSQLPVIGKDEGYEVAEGIITYEGILRGVRNFKLNIEDLKVRDVMGAVSVYSGDDDLFDILNRLKETNAVLIRNQNFDYFEGIITSYDTTEYFRNRTEDLMRVEDIEVTIKDLIKEAYIYLSETVEYELDNNKLDKAVRLVSNRGQNNKPKTFDELTMAEYINLLTLTDTWEFFQSIFNLPADSVKSLLHSIREIRNLLAHFRGDLSAEQRDRLKFAASWLTRCQEEYQKKKERERTEKLETSARFREENPYPYIQIDQKEAEISFVEANAAISSTDFTITDSAKSGGRYAALADWLQSQPGRVEQIPLSFSEIEEIIGSDLPDSARVFRAWWANDSVGHSHSQLWLAAGWRTTYVNLNEGKVTFSRIREREKAYISFFSKLLDDLRKANFPVRDVSPDGTSWIVLQPIPRHGPSYGSFSFSFSRDKRLRVELYLDLLDKEKTKAAFDQLYAQKQYFESQVGEIEWERLENRRASRLALYKDGQITEENRHTELRKWAVENMIKFYDMMVEPTENAIREARKMD